MLTSGPCSRDQPQQRPSAERPPVACVDAVVTGSRQCEAATSTRALDYAVLERIEDIVLIPPPSEVIGDPAKRTTSEGYSFRELRQRRKRQDVMSGSTMPTSGWPDAFGPGCVEGLGLRGRRPRSGPTLRRPSAIGSGWKGKSGGARSFGKRRTSPTSPRPMQPVGERSDRRGFAADTSWQREASLLRLLEPR